MAMLSLGLMTACTAEPATPTRAPETTPTMVEVKATKPEHLEGIWYNPGGIDVGMGAYYQFEADGTVERGETSEELQQNPFVDGRFWFEDGVYYEEGPLCFPIGSYRVYVESEGGRALGLRFEEIDDSDPSCDERIRVRRAQFVRVD